MAVPDARSLIESHSGPFPIHTENGWLFVYRGRADQVDLVVMEDRFPPVGPMERLGDTDTWHLEVEAPPDALLEYKFGVIREGRRRLIVDPANEARTRDPFGANSIAAGHVYRPPRWLSERPDGGEIQHLRVESRSWNRARDHLLYLPPGYAASTPGPLLILHDGADYLEYAGLAHCLSVLCSTGLIPTPLVFLHRPGQRHTEYSDNPRHLTHVIDEVLPILRREHRIDWVIAGGASLGGIASVSLAYRRPGKIDALMLQSASLVRALEGPYKRGRVLAPAARLTNEILEVKPPLPERVAMSCGTFDGLVEDHRSVVPELANMAPQLTYDEVNAGHHWLCWRDRLEPDLIAAFG